MVGVRRSSSSSWAGVIFGHLDDEDRQFMMRRDWRPLLQWLDRHLDGRLPPLNHDAKAGIRPSRQVKYVLHGAHCIGPQRLSGGAGHRNLQTAVDVVETGYKLDLIVGCEGHSHSG